MQRQGGTARGLARGDESEPLKLISLERQCAQIRISNVDRRGGLSSAAVVVQKNEAADLLQPVRELKIDGGGVNRLWEVGSRVELIQPLS